MQSHYSSELDINIKGLQDAEKGLRKLLNAVKYLGELKVGNADENLEKEIIALCNSCKEFMDDDFNTARLIASLYELASQINIFYNNGKTANISTETFELLKTTFNDYIFKVLGLKEENASGNNDALDKVMRLVIDIRNSARTNKDWATSDKIRDALKDAGIVIKDSKENTTYEVS